MKTNPSLFCPGNRPESRGATEVHESFRLRRQREGWTRMKGSFMCVCSCCGRMILSWLEKAASWECFLVKDEEGMEIITARPPSLVCNQQFLWSTIWDEKKDTQLHKSNHSRVEKCLRCQGPRIMVYIPKCKCCCHKKKREQSDYSGWKQTDHMWTNTVRQAASPQLVCCRVSLSSDFAGGRERSSSDHQGIT